MEAPEIDPCSRPLGSLPATPTSSETTSDHGLNRKLVSKGLVAGLFIPHLGRHLERLSLRATGKRLTPTICIRSLRSSASLINEPYAISS
jgi:hypothetical protein